MSDREEQKSDKKQSMSKKKKILIGLGIFIVLIVVWRVNAMMNTKPAYQGGGGVYDAETNKFYPQGKMKELKEQEINK